MKKTAFFAMIVLLAGTVQQAKVVANGINEMANGNDVFGKTMILAVYPELYAIIALIAAVLIQISVGQSLGA